MLGPLTKSGLLLICLMWHSISIAFSIGIGTHLAQDKYSSKYAQSQILRIGKIGVRDEFYWDNFDKNGELTQRGKIRVEELRSLLSSPAIDRKSNLLVLGYGNRYVNGGSWPLDAKSRADFAKYAVFACKTFAEYIEFIEIWNEWNLGTGMRKFGDTPGVNEYIKLAEVVIGELRRNECKTKILVGGAGGDWPNWSFIRGIINSDLPNEAHGISVHLYNHHLRGNNSVEEMSARINSLSNIIQSSRSPNSEIYITEIGYPVDFAGRNSVSGDVAASRAIRILLRAASTKHTQGIWFYELIDSGSSNTNEEHNFGFVDRNSVLKKPAIAIRELINSNDMMSRPIMSVIHGVDVFQFRSDTSIIYAAWSEHGPANETCVSSFQKMQDADVKTLVTEPLIIRIAAVKGISPDTHMRRVKLHIEKCFK